MVGRESHIICPLFSIFHYSKDIGSLPYQVADDLDFWLSREEPSAPSLPTGKDDEPVSSDIHVTHDIETEKAR